MAVLRAGPRHRLEGLDERVGADRLGILPEQLHEQLRAIAGVGFDFEQRHGEPVGLLASALDVIEAEQVPPGLRDARVQPQGLFPGRLGPVVPAQGRIRLPLVEPDGRQDAAVGRLDPGEVGEGQVRLLVLAIEGHLRHQHVGPEAPGMHPEVLAEPPFHLVEAPGDDERGQPVQARDGPRPLVQDQRGRAADQRHEQQEEGGVAESRPAGRHRAGSDPGAALWSVGSSGPVSPPMPPRRGGWALRRSSASRR